MEYAELILATYYLVAMFTRTDGPAGLLWRLRQQQWLPFHCATCLAPWAALSALMASFYLPDALLTILAVAGAVTAANDLIENTWN